MREKVGVDGEKKFNIQARPVRYFSVPIPGTRFIIQVLGVRVVGVFATKLDKLENATLRLSNLYTTGKEDQRIFVYIVDDVSGRNGISFGITLERF
jgi:hypothetical protein